MSTDTDTAPQLPANGSPILPELPPNPDEKPEPPKPDTAPKRPTTRAGRRAAAEARKLEAKGKKDSRPKSPKATPRRAPLETRLTGSLTTLGTVVAATGGMVSPAFTQDGILIVQHAPNVAAALDKVAKDDPRVAAALGKMLTAGVWSGLIAAVLPLAVGIAANHGAIPAHLAGLLAADAPEAPEESASDDKAPPAGGFSVV